MTPEQALVILAWAERDELTSLQRWCPHTPSVKQQLFIELDCREGCYGGAASGGKSDALLMDQLQFADEPGFAGIIFRQSFSDLALPGALMDRSHEWLGGTKAHWDGSQHMWRFPSGAQLAFGYLEKPKDHLRYKSAEFQQIGFDEGTEFREEQYRYMFSRARRRRGVNVPIKVRMGTNPGAKWVQDRFGIPEVVDFSKIYEHEGRVFVPAQLEDNEHIDQEEYIAALEELDSVTYQQLRKGLWVQDATGLVYYELARNLEKCLIDQLPAADFTRILSCDFGVYPDPTAFAVWCFHRHDPAVFLAESEQWLELSPGEAAELAIDWDRRHGGFEQIIGDTGGLGKGFQQEWATRFRLPMHPAEKNNKLGYIKLMNGDYKRGLIKIVRGANEQYIEDAKSLAWDTSTVIRREHPSMPNHLPDAGLYGWRACRGWAWAEEPQFRPKPDVQAQLESEKRKEAARQRVIQRLKRNPRAWMNG